MKVYLADLSHTQTVSDTELTVPLNIGYLKAYADNESGANTEISLFKHPKKLLDDISRSKPGIVGLSYYSWDIG